MPWPKSTIPPSGSTSDHHRTRGRLSGFTGHLPALKVAESWQWEYIAAMRKITAGYAITAVLVGFIYAPLFHLHGGDAHDMSAPVLHAHFPEREDVPADIALSPYHSHSAAKSIDVLTATSVHVVQIGAAVTGVPFELDPGMTSFGFVRHDGAAHAHAPPVIESCNPRAPPAQSL
jgi:hypothetical protein